MKRDFNIYNYGHAVNQEKIAATLVEPPYDFQPSVQDSHDPKDSFLKIVFALDERTKLPTGDLGFLVSDKVNPEVRQWVLNNLMIDTSSAANPAAPAGMSDDDIAELSRNPHEDQEAYMNRINDYMRYHQDIYDRLSSDVSKGDGAGEDVSSKSE